LQRNFQKDSREELVVLADILPEEHKTTVKEISSTTMRFRATRSEKLALLIGDKQTCCPKWRESWRIHRPRDVGSALVGNEEDSKLNF
jgi:hypothetical protein